MIEVRAPIDLAKYRVKAAFGLTLRQLACSAGAVALSTASYFALRHAAGIGSSLSGYIAMAGTVPLFAMGFIDVYGMPFERYAIIVIKRLLSKNTRPYATHADGYPKEGANAGADRRRGRIKKGREKEFGPLPRAGRAAKKAAQRKVKAAKAECLRLKKEASRKEGPKKLTEQHPLREDV